MFVHQSLSNNKRPAIKGMQLGRHFGKKPVISCLLLRYPVIANDFGSASVLGDNLDIVLVPGYNYHNHVRMYL